MSKFTLTHEINCNAETFWKTFFDNEFNTRLFLEGLSFRKYSIVNQQEQVTQIINTFVAEPNADLPGPVQKLLGSNFNYTEEGTFDKSTQIWRWKAIPSTSADKLRAEGITRVEPIGSDKVRRIAEVTLEAKIFGVGGLIESSAEKQVREACDKSAIYMNKFLAASH